MSSVRTEKDRLFASLTSYGSAGVSNPGPSDRGPQDEEDALRRKLKYFFMSPCDKYHAKGRKPFKLGLQLLKIIIVTVQVIVKSLQTPWIQQLISPQWPTEVSLMVPV